MDDWIVQEAMKQHAYTLGQCVLAMARIEGMKAENVNAEQRGDTLPYGEKQFNDAMTEFAIDHSSVISAFTF
jgi:hypothetical protein